MPPSPHLSDEEWFTLELFVGLPVSDRSRCESAFWEDTFAHEHALPDTYKRLAWLGDRVLNLALADRRELEEPSTRQWGFVTHLQTEEQSGRFASAIVEGWPSDVQGLLRLGNSRQGASNLRIRATYAEALIGLVFREHGYDRARDFVCLHWGFLAPPAG